MRDYSTHRNDTYSRMRDRLTLQRETAIKTDSGAERKSWSTIATMQAMRVATPQMGEDTDTMQITATQTVTWLIRHRPDIKENDRILHADKTYDILAIEPDGMRSFMKLTTYVNLAV